MLLELFLITKGLERIISDVASYGYLIPLMFFLVCSFPIVLCILIALTRKHKFLWTAVLPPVIAYVYWGVVLRFDFLEAMWLIILSYSFSFSVASVILTYLFVWIAKKIKNKRKS
jgi:hypothetical protein